MRSVIHGIGFISFIQCLKHLSPVCALCLQGTTIVANTSLIRFRRAISRHTEFGYIIPSLMGSIFCYIIANGRLRDYGIDIVEERTEDFNKGFRFALFSGLCLGFVSRLSQYLSKTNLLPHESFMAFYESLFTSCFAIYLLLPDNKVRMTSHEVIMSTKLIVPFTFLFALTTLKTFVLERGTM